MAPPAPPLATPLPFTMFTFVLKYLLYPITFYFKAILSSPKTFLLSKSVWRVNPMDLCLQLADKNKPVVEICL